MAAAADSKAPVYYTKTLAADKQLRRQLSPDTNRLLCIFHRQPQGLTVDEVVKIYNGYLTIPGYWHNSLFGIEGDRAPWTAQCTQTLLNHCVTRKYLVTHTTKSKRSDRLGNKNTSSFSA